MSRSTSSSLPKREELGNLAALALVAQQKSFTRAAAQLGMSASALSHAIKSLESRLGTQLLARSTRSVAPTEAGAELLRTLTPALNDISRALQALPGRDGKAAGTIRITATQHAARAALWPLIPKFLDSHPEVCVEISADDAFVDIVAAQFDAGVRFPERPAQDMVGLPIGPQLRPCVVAAPSYFARHSKPTKPEELAEHRCINYRYATSGGLFAWEFESHGNTLRVRPPSALIFDDLDLIVSAALAGRGVAFLMQDIVAPYVADGRLVAVLTEYCKPWGRYQMYYPGRGRKSPAFAAFISTLRAASSELER